MKKNVLIRLLFPFLLLFSFVRVASDDFFKIKKGIVDNAWKKTAFFYIKPALTLENLGYTSNIYYFKEMEEPDWTADIGLDVLVSSILGNRFVISLQENPYYSFYAENVDQRAMNNRLKTTVYSYAGNLNFKYAYGSDYIRGRPTSEFGAYIRMRTNEHLLSIDYGRYNNFFFNLYFKQNGIKHLEENYPGDYNVKNYLDRREMNTGLRLNKNIFTQTLVFLNVEYSETKFDNESLRNGTGRKASMGIVFPEIGRIRGSLELGLKYFTPTISFFKNYSKPFGSGEISVSLLRRFKFKFQYLVDNFYSYWNVDQSFDERSLGANMEYYINRNIKIGYNYHLGVLFYENLADGKSTRQDNFYTSALYLGLKVFRNMGIGLEYRRYYADSDVQNFIRSNDFIGGYIIHEF